MRNQKGNNDEPPELDLLGRTKTASGSKHPPQLQALLLAAEASGAGGDVLGKIVTAYYTEMEGAANSVAVYQSIVLSAVYNAIRHDVKAAAQAIPDHVRQAAEEQGELIRKDLRAQIDQARKEEQAAREKQLSELRETVEEIRERESKVAAKQAKGWQERALNYTLVFGVGLIVSPFLSAGIDAIRRFIHPG
jgi:hypothetical protein